MKLRDKLWKFLPVDIEAKRLAIKDQQSLVMSLNSDEKHLEETAKWLCRAQDNSSSDDGGVSRAFKTTKYQGYGSYGWQPSYPETTGYIIPTMIVLGKFFNNNDYLKRAIKMADWEISVQMSSGAVMGSVIGTTPTPAVFNTGQVVFGWITAYIETKNNKYLEAAKKAGNFLISVQDPDGLFDKDDSQFSLKGSTTYNTRVAWALIELGKISKEEKYIEAGSKNIEKVLKKQNGMGWFADNCLNNPQKPLLHTIAYAVRGVLESGISLNNSKFIKAACLTLNALAESQSYDGRISGRLDKSWNSAVNWDCVTGNAQTAIAWIRAYSVTGEEKYKKAARHTIDVVKATQDLDHLNPGIRGGVKGSFPFDGYYGQYEMLNWAAKFFCDALLMENDNQLAKDGIIG